jgi:hypothetical protein
VRLGQPRAVHRATRLADGTVLITGGCTRPGCGGFDAGRQAEVFDADGSVRTGPSMSTGRASNTATLLDDGRVLLTGGYPGEGRPPTSSTELYDPARREFTELDRLATPRADHSATRLADGRVLVAGGFDDAGTAVSSTEVFDPRSGSFTAGPPLSSPRAGHVATRVGGAVVLVGGTVDSFALRTTDVLLENTWRPGPRLGTARLKHGVAALDDRRMLVVGGATETDGRERLATTEVVDLVAGSVRPGPILPEGEYKLDGAVAVIDDGRVVMPSGSGLAVFDQRTGRLTSLPATTHHARSFRTVTAIGHNQVLVAGGYDDAIRPTDEADVVTVPRPTA